MNRMFNGIFVRILTTAILLVVASSTLLSANPSAAQNKQGTSASQEDKVKACNDLADKRGLKGDDRKTFLKDCLNRTSNTQSLDDVTQRDKLNACNNLADRKNLKGQDRRSFLKDCMNKVNSR